MVDLAQWLRAVLDTDAEANASPYAEGAWHTRDCASIPDVQETSECDCGVPARVLREIDAKRQLLDLYAEVAANDVDDVEYAHGWANALGTAVRLAALPYAARLGFREEWAP